MDLPKHVAIIMDGNGRWAQLRGRPRAFGHVKGTRVAKKIITDCSRMGISHLTLYAFSTENWQRPQPEVILLMRILRRYLERETANLVKENIRLTVIGEVDRLSPDVHAALNQAVEATSRCTGLNLVFALSYGSRQEIARAAGSLASLVAQGKLRPEDINEDTLARALWTFGTPDPDLVIRTSGEKRMSNFLLWQTAYAELWFTDTLWPDFTKSDLLLALKSYGNRQRRYGRIGLVNEKLPDAAP